MSDGLRNRKQRGSSAKQELAQPLIANDDETDDDDHRQVKPLLRPAEKGGERNQRPEVLELKATEAAAPQTPAQAKKQQKTSSWDSVSCAAWSCMCAFLDAMPKAVGAKAAGNLKVEKRKELHLFQESCLLPYTIGNPLHKAKLQVLWENFNRIIPPSQRGNCATTDINSETMDTEAWKHFGFQGVNPGTDFRGAGVLALDNLNFMCEAHPELVRMCNDAEYPFAIAAINVTMSLLNLLDLTHGKTTCLATTQKNASYTAHEAKYKLAQLLTDPTLQASYFRSCPDQMYGFMSQEPHTPKPVALDADAAAAAPSEQRLQSLATAFNVVHCVACFLLHKEWMASNKNIMEFNSILKLSFTKTQGLLRDAKCLLDLGAILPEELFFVN